MKFPSHAKINIGLNVISRRPDGYHNLESLFMPIGLHDDIEIHETDAASHILEIDGLELGCNVNENLILRAARLVDVPPVHIRLTKRIPTGAGMGGGSSDAATTLKMLNIKYSLGLQASEMQNMLSRIGADCPFFVLSEPQFAEGIGEKLTPIDVSAIFNGLHIVVIKPDVFVSTREAFSGIKPRPTDYPILLAMHEPVSEWRNLIRNDFEESIFRLHPEIGAIKDLLYDAGALYAQMTGSGASVFGLFADSPTLPDYSSKYFIWKGTL